MTVPICSRSGDVIEPVMKPQWWVNSRVLAQEALAAIKQQGIKIEPPASEREFYRWMDDIQDWCISRQLWWGHRIPAYFVKVQGAQPAAAAAASWLICSARSRRRRTTAKARNEHCGH